MDRGTEKMHMYMKTIHPATAVDHCLQSHFTGPTQLNLIIIKSNILEIYHVTDRPDAPLVLYKHYELHAPVADIIAVRFSEHATDCLLLAFAEAKVSMICFDAGIDDIATVSLHYLEDDFLMEERCKRAAEDLRLQLEPNGRCAALFCYHRWLLVLPFTQDEDLLFGDSNKPKFVQPVLEKVKEKLPIGDSVTVDLHSLGLEHVRDLCFLSGFAEPTVAVLHEQDATWAGHLAAKQLTCSVTVMALSGLPHAELQFPVILRAPNLPHDSQRLLPTGDPASGVLLVSHNAIAHISQIRIICCSVNDYGREELAGASYSVHTARQTAEKGADGAPLCVSLQNCRVLSLSPTQVLFALKSGELYSLQLATQGGMLHAFHFAAGSTTTTVECMCKVGEYLFFGSRVGDSWLVLPVQYSSGPSPADTESSENDPVAESSVDLDAFYNAVKPDKSATTENKPKDTDLQSLFDIFADTKQERPRAVTSASSVFAIRKVDSLLNVGPIVNATFGESASVVQDESNLRVALAKRMARSYWEKLQTLEFVVCSGHGQTGAIHILQQGIRPTNIKSSQLEAVQGLWALQVQRNAESFKKRKREDGTNATESNSDMYDTHLLITRARGQNQGTMVWQCSEGRLEEVGMEEAGFELRGLTVNVFTMFGGYMTIQVLQRYMAILKGLDRACNVFFVDPEQSPPQLHAHHAELVEPYLVLLTTQGTLLLFTFHGLEEQERLLSEMAGKEDSRPKSAAFVDMGHKLDCTPGLGRITAFNIFTADSTSDPLLRAEGIETHLFCFVWWSSGALEIYSLPEFRSLFLCQDMALLPDVGHHSGKLRTLDERQHFHAEYATEMLVRRVGGIAEAPYLFLLLSTGDLQVYSMFRFPHATATDAPLGALRLRRFCHRFSSKGVAPISTLKSDDEDWFAKLEQAGLRPRDRELLALTPCQRHLIPFNNVGSYRGVFVCGDHPLWVFTYKGHLVMHGMTGVEGAIRTMTPFHIQNCPHGFVDYRIQERSIHINLLHSNGLTGHKTLSSWWPMVRIPLQKTPHFVMFHPVQRSYTVVTSVPERYKPRPSELVDPDDEELQQQLEDQLKAYYARHVPHATQERYSVELYSSDTWEKLDTITLDENEVVVAAKLVQISKEDRSSQVGTDDDELNLRRRKGADVTTVQCIGTGFVGDEDMAGRGRVLLLDVYPRISSRKNDRKFLVLYHKPTKGPITAITSLHGYLCLAVSSKVMMYFYDWSTRRLIIASFYDAQFFITSMCSIKNLLLYGDAYRSVYFARWREETRQLYFLGKDFTRAEVVTTELLYEGPQLAMVSFDANLNVSVLSFNPEDPQTSQGLWLMPIADMHLDSLVPCLLPLKGLKANPNNPYLRIQAEKAVLLYGTTSGQIGYLFPIAEDKYRRLSHLCTKLYTEMPHYCGLHPKSHRVFKGERSQSVHPTKNRSPTIIDGDLLAEYPGLDRHSQLQLARKAGSWADAINLILQSISAEFPYF